ncbi:MAG: NrfD/PsrC family molybdoenzyme membrane anchor subunit [Actinomycetota bacterium]
MSDRRHIDPRVGILEGEGSHQRVSGDEAAEPQPYAVWESLPSERRDGPTYYDRPAIKEPVWIWAVPAYFYAGGAAGAAAVLGEVARSLGDGGLDGVVRRSHVIAAAGGVAGTALLVYDLGRPERFLNMLRVFRVTSPMSIGSWILAAATPAFGAAALWGDSLLGRLAGRAGALLGLPLSGYTAVLVSTTAVPVWQQTRKSLPLLFVASAATSAASLLEMGDLDEKERRVVTRFGITARIAELAAGVAVEKEADRVERVGKPLKEGLSGSLWKAAKLATAGGLALSLVASKRRSARLAAGALGTVGALALRFAIFHAGKTSARDPRATFDQQREPR